MNELLSQMLSHAYPLPFEKKAAAYQQLFL